MMRLVRLPIQPVLYIGKKASRLVIVGPIPTRLATVIGNRANQRVMVVSYTKILYGLTGILIMIRNSMTVAHPVPTLKKLNVDEDL